MTELTEKPMIGWAPTEFQQATLNSPKHYAPYVDSIRRFLDAKGFRVLVLCGPVGRGKTHLCWAIIREYIGGIRWARYWHARAMSEAIIEAPSRAEEFKRIPLLVIDELTRDFQTPAAIERRFEQVDHRYNNGLPLVVAGNFKEEDLAKVLGEAVYDRFRSNMMVITSEGESLRK